MMKRTPRIFLDLDGVLADFVAGAARLHGRDAATVTTWDFWEAWGMTASDFWPSLSRDFWASLPLTLEASAVVAECESAVGASNVCVLTACQGPGAWVDGKRDWLRQHFPQFERRHLIGAVKGFCASPSLLLVDDSDENVRDFHDAGGHVCLFPRPWNRARGNATAPLAIFRMFLAAFVAMPSMPTTAPPAPLIPSHVPPPGPGDRPWP